MYWVIEAIPENSMTETEIFWGDHEGYVVEAVAHAKSFARSIMRPKGMRVRWAVYGPFKIDRSSLFEKGII